MKTLKKLWSKIVFEYNSIHNSVSFWYNKRKAIKLHKQTGKRYHVVPRSATTLMVVDNTYIDAYNKIAKKQRQKQITIIDLLKMSYFSTSVNSPVNR